MTAKAIMIQGTSSHAGKSLLVAALCRIFSNRGFNVAPFKSQNMSLNSYVTKSGHEIARSQVLQAIAARTELIKEFNPILLKPKGNRTAQLILLGKPYVDYKVNEFYLDLVPKLKSHLEQTVKKLKKMYDLIVIEGAGSPAEINIMDRDLANMYAAKIMDAPVILIADIDRGGVFANIYGTIKLLKKEDQKRIKYFVINKFRGDLDILQPGIEQLEEMIGIKCLGVIPYIEDLRLPAEDSVSLADHKSSGSIQVKVIKFPRISNFNDFEILGWEPDINVTYITDPQELDDADVIILPGTKNTVKDLNWLKQEGFFTKLKELNERNHLIIGICGGYQMLGDSIIDLGIEGEESTVYEGLGLLAINTEFSEYNKITTRTKAKVLGIPFFNDISLNGYEIHMGITKRKLGVKPLLKRISENEVSNDEILGAINHQQNVFGCYIHGFWDDDGFRKKFIEFLYFRKKIEPSPSQSISFQKVLDANLEKLASVVEENINMEAIIELIK